MDSGLFKDLQSWIPIAKLREVVQLEAAVVVVSMAILSWLIYALFLRSLSAERHRIFKHEFRRLLFAVVNAALFFGLFALCIENPSEMELVRRLTPYIGLIALIFGCLTVVRTLRVFTYEYLFFNHMRRGVPLLLIDIFTLFIVLVLGTWGASYLFEVRLTPLLATSAAVSLVLGLAMQDTLGNLFAGVALQIDKPYEIGDWIEIYNNGQKISGQVYEISWRATVLTAFSDETISIPNRLMAQAQVSVFNAKLRPFTKAVSFRVKHGTDVEKAKKLLLGIVFENDEVSDAPAPLVLLSEVGESYLTLRLIFSIENYARQNLIASEIQSRALLVLTQNGIELGSPRMEILNSTSTSSA